MNLTGHRDFPSYVATHYQVAGPPSRVLVANTGGRAMLARGSELLQQRQHLSVQPMSVEVLILNILSSGIHNAE